MTVENQTNKTAPQVMGSSFTYDFHFRVLTEDPTEAAAKEGIKVSVSNGTTTTDLTYGTDYSVALNSDGTGGTVTVVDKLTSDYSLIIYRNYDITQGSDYNNYNAFPAETLERNLDKLTMITQQLSEENSRAVKVGMFSDTDPAELVNEIEVIYDHKTEVIAVANNITDVVAVSADLTNVDIVATNISDVNTVAGYIASVNTVAGDKTNIDTVAGDINRVNLVADDISSVHTVAIDISNVIDVAGNKTNIDTVAGISTDVTTVASIATAVSNVSAIESEVLDVSDNRTDISTVATNISNVNTVAGVSTAVSTVANNDANVTTVATNIYDVNTAAANMTAIQNAPTAASNAASSATLAQEWATKMDGQVASTDYSSKYYASQSANSESNSSVWAEGTDVQVQALGGVHSAKGWAEQSTNANVDLSNLSATGQAVIDGKANVAADNFSADGKKAIVGLCVLDYSAGSDVTASAFASTGTGYQPTKDGVLYVSAKIKSGDTYLYLYIYDGDGQSVGTRLILANDNASGVNVGSLIPVDKNYSYRVPVTGAGNTAVFYPYKGA